jgi:hypothetical protein
LSAPHPVSWYLPAFPEVCASLLPIHISSHCLNTFSQALFVELESTHLQLVLTHLNCQREKSNFVLVPRHELHHPTWLTIGGR